MTQYSTAFKARVLQRLVGPRAISANRLATEVGVPQVTLSRWLASARSVPRMTTPQKQWTGAQKLRVVNEAGGVDALGDYLRTPGRGIREVLARLFQRPWAEIVVVWRERVGRIAAT